MCSEYEISKEEAVLDVTEFVETLKNKKVLS